MTCMFPLLARLTIRALLIQLRNSEEHDLRILNGVTHAIENRSKNLFDVYPHQVPLALQGCDDPQDNILARPLHHTERVSKDARTEAAVKLREGRT